MIGRGTLGVVGVVALAVVLPGCSDGSAPPARPATVTVTPTATPSSVAPSSPAASPSPTLPAAAQQPTRPGAEAFARHFFAAYNYAFWTADPAPVEAISDSACAFCRSTIDTVETIRAEHDRAEGGRITVAVAVAAPGDPKDRLLVNLLVHQEEGHTVSPNGRVMGTTAERVNGRIDIAVRWTSQHWIMLAAHVLKNGES